MGTPVGRREPGGFRRVALWTAAIVAVVVVVLLMASRGSSPTHSGRPPPPLDPGGPGATAAGPLAAAKPPLPPRQTGDGIVVEPGVQEPVDYRELYANFLEAARFPPLSRPLGPEQHDLLEPNARHEGAVMITRPVGNRRLPPEESYFALLTADRYMVTGADTLTATLAVWKGEQPGPGLPLEIESATVSAFGPWGEDDVGTVRFEPVKSGAGTTYRAVIDPTSLGATRVGDYRIDLFFTGPDGESTVGRLDFLYTPAAEIPARFTGKLRDRIEDGSLLISAEVDVRRAGRYDLNGNLFDEQGRPIGWSRAMPELQVGTRWVDLPYFGLIFHDKKASGRFELRDLRGMRVMPGETPDRELMPGPERTYKTARYRLEDFSAAEWNGPDKQAQIDMYEQRIEEQDQGVPPP